MIDKYEAFIKHMKDEYLTKDQIPFCTYCSKTINTIHNEQMTEIEKLEDKFKSLYPHINICVLYYKCDTCGIKNSDDIENLLVGASVHGYFCKSCREKMTIFTGGD